MLEDAIRAAIYNLQGGVMTPLYCEQTVQELLKIIKDWQEFERTKQFMPTLPVVQEDP